MQAQNIDQAGPGILATTTTRPRRGVLGWLKVVLLMGLALFGLIILLNWMWINSGSNEWKLQIDRDGAQVYTLKTPGSASLKIRGVTQSDEFTLSNHLAPFFDESIQEDCGKWVEGCVDYKILKPWDPQTQVNVTMWTVGLFPPFAPREFLLMGRLAQDPVSKVVTLENIAVPNKLEPNDCCVRLQQVHNVWNYTPMQDGSVKVELLYDLSMGGLFPSFLLNLGGPEEIHKMLTRDNPELLRRDAYRSAHFDFIKS